MTHTYYKLHYHLVWSTKERQNLILPSFQKRLYEYICGMFKAKQSHVLEIGGISDHIHILVEIPPRLAISELIRYVKVGSSKWLHQSIAEAERFEWQEGYGAFTVSSPRNINVIKYIQKQDAHHKKHSFKEEFIGLLNQYGVSFDPQYLWK